jgi:ABC-type cobalamin/Fe3+-siderophores transport system ATPase subunit
MSEAGLAVTGAWVEVGKKALLADVDLRLQPGELIAVVGRNGAGKTTLLRLLAGLVEPSGGTVVLGARELNALTAAERAKHIAFLAPARLPLPTGYTVRQIVGSARFARHSWWRSTGVNDRLVDSAIEAMELAELADRSLETLSDGERQRVWLAGLLAQEAEYVLLDEPTSHLDASHAVDGLRTLAGWARGGKCVVVVLHDLDAALAVADRVVLIEAGRVVLDEPATEVTTGELGWRLGVRLVEVVLDGRRRVLVDGLVLS